MQSGTGLAMTSRVATMQVTTHADGLHVRFPYSAALVERIKQVRDAAWDKERRVWVVPTAQADSLMEEFPQASFDYGAFCAACDAHEGRERAFYESMVQLGVKLEIDAAGAVYGVHEAMTDVLQAEIRARSEGLRRCMDRAHSIREGVR